MIKSDSRKIKEGDTFIALKGVNNDGHEYILDAIKRGAKKIIAEYGHYEVETLIVDDTREYLNNFLYENYYSKIKKLKLIGVTGTNGKTTTCYLLYQTLNMLNIKCAYIGTLGFYNLEYKQELNNTTPDILDIYEMLLYCAKNDYRYVAMEVSSQGLAYNRLSHILFDYAVFTNLTEDHLDYHKTMDNYAKEKQKLFSKLKDNSITIINNDDSYKDYFKQDSSVTYGFSSSDYVIDNYQSSFLETTFTLNNRKYTTKLIGKHNVYNLSIVIIILETLQIDYNIIYKVISKLEHAKGRMDAINYKDNLIIIDYAHTPDAVEKIINSVKNLGSHIITIIGCGGNRDKQKRPIMGRIATSLSDYVIFTSDNPRNENPNRIIQDIIQKLDTNNYEIEENREKAIKKGIQKLNKNDILLLLGKGHENYQIINGKKYHFSDIEVVLKNI
ncbi:MAG: UDP-N-acetylmuramoyl-L-alanyl-D-glutamate--2,6-diaminopimelate ligase [Bacilli bacterium]|nr:UDP-N-acetylmuramoyl-L-alanyl-D-glutamate--2,6-diaminopimelate ligase [Bacilli bacterium]